MKQHITSDQLDKLSEKEKGRLRNYLRKNKIEWPAYNEKGAWRANVDSFGIPLLSIGQMIEFLVEQETLYLRHIGSWIIEAGCCDEVNSHILIEDENELCDALWKAVKEVLDKK